MKGNHSKRRKDKYNPYSICELEGHYYISFKDTAEIIEDCLEDLQPFIDEVVPQEKENSTDFSYDGYLDEMKAFFAG